MIPAPVAMQTTARAIATIRLSWVMNMAWSTSFIKVAAGVETSPDAVPVASSIADRVVVWARACGTSALTARGDSIAATMAA